MGPGWYTVPRHPPPLGFPKPSNHCEADESGFPRVTWDAKLHGAPARLGVVGVAHIPSEGSASSTQALCPVKSKESAVDLCRTDTGSHSYLPQGSSKQVCDGKARFSEVFRFSPCFHRHSGPGALPPGGTFTDDNGNIFEGAIEAIAAERITLGCNPPANTHYCPDDLVTRGQMAIFLVRAFDYIDNGGGNLFVDDDGLVYEDAADRLKTAGITQGTSSRQQCYCGNDLVTRGQMAGFLTPCPGTD